MQCFALLTDNNNNNKTSATVAMKQTLGRQVVSTVPVKNILLLQCGPQAGAGPGPGGRRPAGRRRPAGSRGLRARAGPCTLGYTNVVAVALAKTAAIVRKCAFSPICIPNFVEIG